MGMLKKFKKSYYTLVDEYNNSSFLINTYTRAVAKLLPEEKEDILRFLLDTSDESYKYFPVLYKNGFIVPSDIDEISKLQYFYDSQFYDQSNLTITLLPTLRCNFACPYCFENEHTKEMSLIDIDLFFKAVNSILSPIKNLHIALFGGEPLLSWSRIYPYLKEINNHSRNRVFNYSASITTNGYLLNTINYDELINANIRKIHITLDCNKKNHDSLRSTRSGLPTFDVIITNARDIMHYMLIKHYQIKIIFRTNLLNNTKDDVKEYLDSFSDDDKKHFLFYFKPIFNTNCFEISNNNAVNYKDISMDAKQRGFKIISPFDKYGFAFCSGDGGKNSIMITPDLKIWKCFNDANCHNACIGYINDKGFNWDENKIAKWYLKSPFNDRKCITCKKLPICFGGCPLYFSTKNKRHCIDSATMNLARDFLLDS